MHFENTKIPFGLKLVENLLTSSRVFEFNRSKKAKNAQKAQKIQLKKMSFFAPIRRNKIPQFCMCWITHANNLPYCMKQVLKPYFWKRTHLLIWLYLRIFLWIWYLSKDLATNRRNAFFLNLTWQKVVHERRSFLSERTSLCLGIFMQT